MSIIFTLLTNSPYLDFPQSSWGRFLAGLGWLLLFGVVVGLLRRWRVFNISLEGRLWRILAVLAFFVPLTVLFIGVRLSAETGLTPPCVPIDPSGPTLMIFAVLPWVLAGGLLGPTSAAALAAFSGLLLALWDTRNPFTPLELALLAVLFSAAMNQRYRTRVYRFLRHPLAAAITLSLLYPLIFLVDISFTTSGTLVSRLDYALTHVGLATVAFGVEMLVAGLFAEVVAMALPSLWGSRGPLQPSPSERSIEARFQYGMVPLAFVLILTLMVGNWVVAGNASRQILRERMENAAKMAAESVPYFLETGQNLISQLASDSRLYSSSAAQLNDILARDLRRVPYFHQLFVLDRHGNSLAGYPYDDYNAAYTPPEEQAGIQLALTGVPFQSFTIPPGDNGSTANVSFVAAIFDDNSVVRGVMVGRTDLASNPFSQPILASLRSMAGADGEGLLLDENDRILYHPDPNLVMTTYTGRTATDASFFDDIAPDGTRRLVYYQPAEGRPWSIVLAVPAHRAQQMALDIAAPLLGMIVVLSILTLVLLRLGLRVVTGSLQNLAVQAGNIAKGQLDHPLSVIGEDEIGQLSHAFEQMRVSLKARLDDLNSLLLVSQGVASSMEMDRAVKPLLESALGTGAIGARVVLSPAVMPKLEGDASVPVCFALGPTSESYNELDEQILALTHDQDQVVLTNLYRSRLIKFSENSLRPHALAAVALRHENLYYGCLWIAFDQPHQFSKAEVRFLVTLAGQAALAAANSRLFLNAEFGRQRLAAILASTPDPVLVTDQQDRLLLANPAAWQVLGLGVEWDEGRPIEKVIFREELVSLLRSSTDEKQSVEVTLPDGRVYSATASSVLAEGQRVGRVCVMRDVTYFKDLDTLKSEFVATVSHDLRSPLTLMRGYASMLEMVGELNEQQISYVLKIVGGVERMSRLVNNLLDLGRIEAGVGLQLGMVPVRDVVEQVTEALQLQANQKRIQFNVDISDQITEQFQADQALVQQALHNLVENAIKYTDAGGRVQVRVESDQNHMLFQVSDTGIGIAPVDQARLFEKFYRGAQLGTTQTRGTGLGLAIVKSIAERHGGKVWLKSQLGKGSSFYLEIPLNQPQDES